MINYYYYYYYYYYNLFTIIIIFMGCSLVIEISSDNWEFSYALRHWQPVAQSAVTGSNINTMKVSWLLRVCNVQSITTSIKQPKRYDINHRKHRCVFGLYLLSTFLCKRASQYHRCIHLWFMICKKMSDDVYGS